MDPFQVAASALSVIDIACRSYSALKDFRDGIRDARPTFEKLRETVRGLDALFSLVRDTVLPPSFEVEKTLSQQKAWRYLSRTLKAFQRTREGLVPIMEELAAANASARKLRSRLKKHNTTLCRIQEDISVHRSDLLTAITIFGFLWQ